MVTDVRFGGRVAIVTGGASGIGAATAARLAAEGASVILADIDEQAGTATAHAITSAGGTAVFQPCDVTAAKDWTAIVGIATSRFGRLDIVHNNAYLRVISPADELPEEDWRRQVDVCLTAVYLSVRATIGSLRLSQGNIVNTASCHALLGVHGHPAYAAAKGAVCALTRQLAVEYGPLVRVNAVLPGGIDTPSAWLGVSREERDRFCAQTVTGRMGTAAETAAAICFLASDDASFITGTELVVDGGWLVSPLSPTARA